MKIPFATSKSCITTADGRVRYLNFWDGQTAEEIWFTAFLRARGLLDRHPRRRIVFVSVLGNRRLPQIDRLLHPFSRRLFFTGENLRSPSFAPYTDHMKGRSGITLSLGFEAEDGDPRYMRFPLWILELVPPDADRNAIRNLCQRLSLQQLTADRDRFCALVSGNRGPQDEGARLRTEIVQGLASIAHVDCAGRLLHNTDELQQHYHDDKLRFLRHYRYFVCPENSDAPGYVTEKPFHALMAGCIPIYRGSLGSPEPEILNPDALLLWQPGANNRQLLDRIADLERNPNAYRDLFHTPRLLPQAADVIADRLDLLERRLDLLLR